MRVVQHELADAHPCDARAQLTPRRRRRLRRELECAGEACVLAADAHVERWHRQHESLLGEGRQRAVEQVGVVHRVHAERQVRAVSLDGTKWEHRHRLREVSLRKVRCAPLPPQARAGPTAPRAGVAGVRAERIGGGGGRVGGGGGGGDVRTTANGRSVSDAVRGSEGASGVGGVGGGALLFPGSHFTGVEQPVRVDAPLEAELRPVRHLHPAVLEHVRVRVEDGDAVGLVPRENLAQPLVGGLPSLALWPEQRERGEARAASEVDHLEVLTA
mmetsp:Transcript_4042/g.13322  ORF Transcript_4042/g.13322 Transcript_4042/m.13322 type:complete len:273 (+) Transcript_4042:643-1461(+)